MFTKTAVAESCGYSSAHFSKRVTTVRLMLEEDGSTEFADLLLTIGIERQNKSLVEETIDYLYVNGDFEAIMNHVDGYIAENSFDNFIIEILKFIADNKKYSMNLKSLWAYSKAITQGERINIPPKEWARKNPNRVQSTTNQQYIYFAL